MTSLLALIEATLVAEATALAERGVRLRFIGELHRLPESLQTLLRTLEAAELPRAFALVNPNRLDEEDEAAAHGHLAAVGVAFLLAAAVVRTLRAQGFFASRTEPALMELLDLVALGTVADGDHERFAAHVALNSSEKTSESGAAPAFSGSVFVSACGGVVGSTHSEMLVGC